VLALPLFHVHGLGVGLHGTLTAGASAVLRRRFDVDDLLDTVDEHAASLWFGVPTMYARIAASDRLPELRRLRLCVSGSAPLSPELFAAVAEGGGQRILERYGMAETLMNVSNPYDAERRPGTVGLPLPGVEARLAERTDEILLRGPNVLREYWERPDATAEAFAEAGWFASGDVGRFDDDGYLRIVGRRKELIISGGFNVYPREVEDVLRSHPGVEDVAVVGLPDPTWGERVTAFVEGEGVSEQQLLELAGEQLAPYKRPKQVVFVDALPRNALGKVTKQALRDRAG
jgi:malonyl-CoA/methylmalonyl-CoA synthetase